MSAADIGSLIARFIPGGIVVDPSRHWCAGGCRTEVSSAGRWCATCATRDRRERRARALAAAYETLPPWEWCRFGAPTFRDRTRGASEAMIAAARGWRAAAGNLVLLGATGIGKTSTMVALGYQILDYARDYDLPDDALRVAAGLRFVNAIDLGYARRNWPLGQGDPPMLLEAREATVLLLDELGREPAWDSTMFELFDYRYRKGRPTVCTSRLSENEMESPERYGVDGARRILETGKVVS